MAHRDNPKRGERMSTNHKTKPKRTAKQKAAAKTKKSKHNPY